ncbi:helix-turn-helix domain-containing protein [Nocardioides sp. MAH-18]|uniref:Helix-turn-helix domain-containing protein n=1 Tax=Nocardioides agri TaxID=2682843 RepID=A0A6L6XXG3_9ACTN|nr:MULTISPECIES: helix-turn-helix transcriptional regulator [unclassified Nocardioides]MBA2952212.1 helix-turn-helix transcriptional regulator [Nocardioides sp. CGMCC 1.13656]MVQ51377.1 helix-turn-helix domain-containing protein [Nocardioides sp. MAH-18]
MTGDTDLAAVGRLVGDRVRAAILLSLLSGGATSASELAAAAGASASLTSAHLRKLLDGGLVEVATSGRQRLYRIASVEVAEMLEAMQLVAPAAPVTSLRGASSRRRLRRARMCYDHLAGVLGIAVTDGLVAREVLADGSLAIADGAAPALAEIGVSLTPLLSGSRPVVRACTDWTERRPHVSGGLGAAVASTFVDRAWVVRRPGSRGLDVTADGAAALEDWLGVRLTDDAAWRDSA